MRGAIETLNDKDTGQRESKKRKSGDVPKSEIMGEEVTHIRAEDAREAKRDPVSQSQEWHMALLHQVLPPFPFYYGLAAPKHGRGSCP